MNMSPNTAHKPEGYNRKFNAQQFGYLVSGNIGIIIAHICIILANL